MKRSGLAGLLGLGLLAALSAPIAAMAQQVELHPGDAAQVTARVGGRVNMRSGPTTQRNNVTGQLDRNDQVTIRDAQRQGAYVWYRVETPAGSTGWIRGDLLEPAADGASGPEPGLPASTPAIQAPVGGPPASDSPPPAPPSAADDWTRFVPPLLQQVDACARSLSMQPVIVTRVFQVEPDMVGVRLRDPTDRRWECLIGRNGSYPIRLDPLGDRVRPMPGDGNPVFVRAPGEVPSDACSSVTQLADPADGKLLGWRVFHTCPTTVNVPRP